MTPIPAMYAAGTFVSTLAGGFFALRFSRWMDRIMAFSGGVLLAAGLLDLMPESIALSAGRVTGELQASASYPALLFAVIGFLIFYLLERMAVLRSYHSHHHHPAAMTELDPMVEERPGVLERPLHPKPPRSPQVGILGAAGLCVHSLLDGFSIGVAFHASAAVGVLVGIAIIAHDFSDGVSTVTLILSSRNTRAASLGWLAADAIAPLAGVILASLLQLPTHDLGRLLGVFAGMFLYLGATHLLPEAHAMSDSSVTVAWMVVGVVLMFGITRFLA